MQFNNKIFNKWEVNANKELPWFSSDTEERYSNNLKDKNTYIQLRNNDWVHKTFTYKFNSNGFRCEEFTDTDSIMFLGCSVTQGIGLPVDTIFPTIIANELGLRCINLGIEGTSADTGFRLAQIWLEKLRPKICVPAFFFHTRLELLTPESALNFTGQWSMIGADKLDSFYRNYYIQFYEKWFLQPENALLNIDKNLLAIEKMCNNLNIKFIDGVKTYNTAANPEKKNHIIKDVFHREPTRARDLIHPGVKFHRRIADSIINKVNS